MKVAIVGANGFVGSRMVEQFVLTRAHEIVPVVRRPSALALAARFDIDWRLADALDAKALAQAIKGCDAVVHCALGDPRQIRVMPRALCEAAASAGIRRVVYLSSASVHGQNIPAGTTEASPLRIDHPVEYCNAKAEAELSLFQCGNTLGLDVYALRPSMVFGPRSKWMADTVNDLLAGRAWLYGQGEGICNTIYVDNLIHAVSCALQATTGAGRPYLIADAETVTWRLFYTSIAELLGPELAGRIHQVDQLPVYRVSVRDRIDRILSTPWVMGLMPAFPPRFKRMVKGGLAAMSPAPAIDHWAPTEPLGPDVQQELAEHQRCTHRITSQKAAAELGYRPPVSFAEGMRRSLLWSRQVLDL